MFQVTFPSGRKIVPALLVVDMQNGFVSKDGSYDRLGMNTSNYREIIPKLKDLIEFCRSLEILSLISSVLLILKMLVTSSSIRLMALLAINHINSNRRR
jgi:Isochorismatase family